MAAPTRIDVRGGRAYVARGDDAVANAPAGEYVDAQSYDAATTALQAAYEGLVSAANQFAAMRESQEAGHFPEVHNNPEKLEEKAAAARAALNALWLPSSSAPTPVTGLGGPAHGRPSGADGDQPSPEPGATPSGDTVAFTDREDSGGDPSQAPAGTEGSDPEVPAGGDGCTCPADEPAHIDCPRHGWGF